MAATANLFALLGGDGDDDIHQLAEKAQPLIEKKAPAAASAPAPKPEGRPDSGRGGRGDRGRGSPRGGRGGFGRGPRDTQVSNGVEEPVGEERGEGRARGFGGRGRGRGRGYDGARPPRREYERRDGTGRGHELQKRGGAGVGNWGTAADDSKEGGEAPVEVPEEGAPPAEVPTEDAAAPAEGAAEPEPEAEPEKPEMTLEEYERQKAEKKAALNKVAEVKTVSMDDFKGMKTYVRKDVEEAIPGLELSKKKADQVKPAKEEAAKEKPKKQVNTIETGFRIAEPDTGRGRGGRGRGRGDRGDRPFSGRGGAGRGPREGGRGPAPAGRGTGKELPIDDAEAFPSLA